MGASRRLGLPGCELGFSWYEGWIGKGGGGGGEGELTAIRYTSRYTSPIWEPYLAAEKRKL